MPVFTLPFFKTNLRTRLVGYYLFFAIVSVGIMTYFTYLQAANSLEASVEDKLITIAFIEEDNINRWVDEQQRTASFLASLPELRALSGQLLASDSSAVERQQANRELTSLIKLIISRTSEFHDIQILDCLA